MTFAENQEIGEWSVRKLQFLESYLSQYLKATKTAMYKYYIDCFAGATEYIHKASGKIIPGSATIALNLNTSEKFDEYFFIEIDPVRIEALEELKLIHPDKNITIMQGDCNDLLPQILKKINLKSPIFIFLDTDGLHIKWNTLAIASKWRSEFLINFPFYMSIKRQMPWDENKMQETSATTINEFYGTDEWRAMLYDPVKSKKQINHDLIHLYEQKLKSLGFKYVLFSDTFSSSTGNKLYYLVFAGNHDAGMRIMKHIFNKQFNPQGQLFDL